MTTAAKQPAPLTDAVLAALAKLVDDAKSTKRQPSHSEIQDQFQRLDCCTSNRARLSAGRKSKARSTVLQWATENDIDKVNDSSTW